MRFIAILCVLAVSPAYAACEFTIDVGDGLEFSTAEMSAESTCETVKVTLNHKGTLPKNAMGHNWVLTLAADFDGVASDAVGAGLDNQYIKPGDDRVIAATKIIGGGESDTIEFSVKGLDASQNYTFFCSFPGHWAVMKGTFKIV